MLPEVHMKQQLLQLYAIHYIDKDTQLIQGRKQVIFHGICKSKYHKLMFIFLSTFCLFGENYFGRIICT